MSTASTGARPVAPGQGRLRPLGLGEVRITGGFWEQRQRTNATATIEHCRDWMARLGWIDNFRAAVEGRLPEDRRGREFSDSDVYKLMEAMAWEIGRSGDKALETTFTDLVDVVAAAQDADGYLNTCFGRPGQPPRYSDLEWGHELYCYGHLFQAAVARGRTRGEDRFVEVARRAADHVRATFGEDGLRRVGGHPEIEVGLAELARFTGERRYLDQAALFIDLRGSGTLADIEWGRSYFQDDLPVREATVWRGHAVRATYLAAGAVDVAVETGDEELLDAVIRQWETTVARRTYLTGGMGSLHTGEAFGDDFVLPSDRAYSETCAGVGAVMASWRLLLATGDPRYADLAERVLFNVVAGSPAPDGRSFFYANTLHQRVPGAAPPADEPTPRASSSLRAPWFSVSCCPTNVARTFASLAAYVATADAGGIQLHQYADATVETTLDDGRRVGIEMRTAYPDDGVVTVRVTRSDGGPWSVAMRVPAWAHGEAVVVTSEGRHRAAAGMVTVEHAFSVGDEIRLELPVAPRWTTPDPRIDAVRGCVAVERGPLVLCAESVDLPGGGDVETLVVDPSVAPRERDGRVVVRGRVAVVGDDDPAWPYHPPEETDEGSGGDSVDVPLVAYHERSTRGPSTMRVWMPSPPGGGKAPGSP